MGNSREFVRIQGISDYICVSYFEPESRISKVKNEAEICPL